MSSRFQLQLERELYTPGDTVAGTILVLAGGRSRSVEVLLQYKEETEDYSDVATGASSGPLHEGDLTTGTSFEFELALPPDALPNYQSKHGKLDWEVNVKSDEFGSDTWERCRINVESKQRTAPGSGS